MCGAQVCYRLHSINGIVLIYHGLLIIDAILLDTKLPRDAIDVSIGAEYDP